MTEKHGFFPNPSFNNFNVNTNHPLIPNSHECVVYKKYVSIHSEDRDITKYPNASQFEIEIPEDLLNVLTIRLSNWSFPSNYSAFSVLNSNVTMTFQITKPYNPGEYMVDSNPLQNAIFSFLFLNSNTNYSITIESGFYNPQQMVTELTNKFNYAITQAITTYFTQQSVLDPEYTTLLNQFSANGGYTSFTIVYNNVSQKIWFGNNSDGFVLTNQTLIDNINNNSNFVCYNPTGLLPPNSILPDFSNWGLPAYLGLTSCNTSASFIQDTTPRFYYGDVNPGDNGYWLLPNSSLPGSQVYYLESPNTINLFGNSYIYMEIDGLNCIDETSPYNLNKFTMQTNQTNGICNSSFAKIAIPTTPTSQWFDRDQEPYKMFLPPAERIRRLKIKMRYHNGELVNFGNCNYSFLLEFTLTQQQIERKFNNWGYKLRGLGV